MRRQRKKLLSLCTDCVQLRGLSPLQHKGHVLISFQDACFLTCLCCIQGLLRWISGKEFPCQCRSHRFDPWVGRISWRRKWQPTPVLLPGESHGQRSLVGYSPWGHKESDMTEWARMHALSKPSPRRHRPVPLWNLEAHELCWNSWAISMD